MVFYLFIYFNCLGYQLFGTLRIYCLSSNISIRMQPASTVYNSQDMEAT